MKADSNAAPNEKHGNTDNASATTNDQNNKIMQKKKEIECLNKACNGKHLLKDCPSTTEALKKEIYREYYSTQNNEPTFSSVTAPQVSTAPNGKFFGMLEDKIEVIIDGDYGADLSGISESHIKQCEQQGLFIVTKHLQTPVEVHLAFSDPENPQVYLSRKKARLSITLNLPIGPFRLRNVEFQVFKEEMPQVILSRPLLQSIGFDLSNHLQLVRDSFQDLDFSHIGGDDATDNNEAPTGLSALLIDRPTPIGVPEFLPEIFNDSTGPTSTTQRTVSSISATNYVTDQQLSNTFYGDTVSDDTYEKDDAMETGEDNMTEIKIELMNVEH